jgi:hypothetical protein
VDLRKFKFAVEEVSERDEEDGGTDDGINEDED